ncbi:MAG: hypothetical protein ABL984_19480 [Pyrinomonadaceae bacterium]
MIQFICLFVLMHFGHELVIAQAEPIKRADCPSVEVAGPAGIVEPGEIAWFSASITAADPDGLAFVWTVSAGKIEKRDGKLKIGIPLSEDLAGLGITATVEVKGFPEGCPSSASETVSMCILPTPALIDEYSSPHHAINKRALSIAAKELEENPNNQMYIVEYFPADVPAESVNRKLKATRGYFSQLKFDLSRITIVTAEVEGNVPLTKIYRVPPGSNNPIP